MSEYAPEYTKKERLLIIAKLSSWGLPLVLATQFWFLPWFEEYAKISHCLDYGYFTGTHVVFYFTFVAIPIAAALTLFAIEGPRSFKVIRLGQNPLPKEKVLKKTKYKYGRSAKFKPYAFLLLLLFMIGLGVRGVFLANDIIYNPENNLPPCSNR